jgi:hypothetical protein
VLRPGLIFLALASCLPGLGADPVPAPKPAPPPARGRLGSAAQRNENVAVYLIDTNAIKEANIRIGTRATIIGEPNAETQHFAAEHGRPAAETLVLRPQSVVSGWHGEASWLHQNSVFNARTFFQVGGVKPSHRNTWGGRFTGEIPRFGMLTGILTQRDIRGMVNGNVLVPLPEERTPLTGDPETRDFITRIFAAYPNELPNRPDFDPRALNTNSPQRIDEIDTTLRLDRATGVKARLAASYQLQRQHISAFQFVAGMNPDTTIHIHRARMGWTRTISAATELSLAGSFQRTMSLLTAPANAVGPRIRFGYQIEELGPDSQFPIDRAQNTFRYGAAMSHLRGAHTLQFGGDFTRLQLNGIESNNIRGYYQFANNFGRTAIENLRWGTPSNYEVTYGDLARGFRQSFINVYFADRWKVASRLQIYWGLRWSADLRPTEVQNRDTVPYPCDCNNFSPRLSFAWQLGRGWTMRAMYTTAFSQIPPVTYQQVRNNPPLVRYVMVNDPPLVDPLAGIDLNDPNLRYSPTVLAPDLKTTYAHQYNATFERKFAGASTLRVGYVGSRTIKLLNVYPLNRAEPVPGIPLTTSTVDLRRPDQRYAEVRWVVNGGLAWYDAALVEWTTQLRRGLLVQAGYSFSKALDEGIDFTATAANKEIISSRNQWQYESFNDRKGLSNFDSPHSFLGTVIYDVPAPSKWRGLLGGWQISSVTLWKKGTPLTLYVGSDAPGFGNVDGGPSDRPNIVDASILGRTIGDPNIAPQIISRSRFAFIRPGDPRGNLGRNTFRKARIWNWNAAAVKQWRFGRGREYQLQWRGEVYNLSNTPQFDEPQRNLSSPSFGRITNTLNDGRVMQVGLRLVL